MRIPVDAIFHVVTVFRSLWNAQKGCILAMNLMCACFRKMQTAAIMAAFQMGMVVHVMEIIHIIEKQRDRIDQLNAVAP